MQDALVYHLTYHYSLGLHINHLLFLHTYLLAVFTIAGGVGSLLAPVWGGAAVQMLFFIAICVYAMSLGGVRGSPYCVFVGLVLWIARFEVPRWLGGEDPSTQAMSGFALMMLSFACQLAGHAYFEIFQAPPDLLHGFFAAPVLEWMSLLGRCGLMPSDLMREVWLRVHVLRETSSG